MRKQAFDLQELASRTTQHALSQLGDLKQIRERPFEILLKYIVPGLFLLKGKWLLSLLFGVSEEVLGIGPSTIGAWIDKAIGKGPNSNNTEPVSESSLEAASKGMVDRIVGGVFSKSSAFRAEIEKCGTIDTQALIVAWAHGPDKIEKAAIGTLATKFRSFFGMNGYATKGLLSGTLFQLLKALLVGVGIHTGTGILFGGIKDKVMPFGGGKSSTPDTLPIAAPGMRLYTNPMNNVAQSLVMALDNAITDNTGKPFSRIFTDLKGYSPVSSPEMGRVLTEVQAAHGGASIQEIGGYKTFAAPPLAEIAKTLLPQATYTKQTEHKPESVRPKGKTQPGDAERELEGIFGGPR